MNLLHRDLLAECTIIVHQDGGQFGHQLFMPKKQLTQQSATLLVRAMLEHACFLAKQHGIVVKGTLDTTK